MIIGIAGMVGTGKTTLATSLADYLNIDLALEPVDAENPWLSRYYEEEDGKRRYGLQLQLHFLATRMQHMRSIQSHGEHCVIDTTWYADADVFAKNLRDEGYLDADAYELYRTIYEELTALVRPPDVMLYLDGPIDMIAERIRRRGRPSERNVDPIYWQQIHDRYRAWAASFDECPLVRLDISEYDLYEEPAAVERLTARALRTVLLRSGNATE